MKKNISIQYSRLLARKIAKDVHPDIRSDQDVHHIDGNPLNNHPGNLIILSDSDHMKHHWDINREQKMIALKIGINKREAKKTQRIISEMESLINLYNEGIYIDTYN